MVVTMAARRVRTSIGVEFDAGEVKGSGKIRNVGLGGFFVSTKAIPEPGEPVCLMFQPPGAEAISVMGLVWWTTRDEIGPHRTPGFGLCLIERNEDYERAVGQLIR